MIVGDEIEEGRNYLRLMPELVRKAKMNMIMIIQDGSRWFLLRNRVLKHIYREG